MLMISPGVEDNASKENVFNIQNLFFCLFKQNIVKSNLKHGKRFMKPKVM